MSKTAPKIFARKKKISTMTTSITAVGASTAYHLALRGVKPIVIERSKVAAAASGKAGGFLAGGWGSGPTVPMHEISFDMHEKLAETLGVTSYRKIPTLSVKSLLFCSPPVSVGI